jgi:hypothetical protein
MILQQRAGVKLQSLTAVEETCANSMIAALYEFVATRDFDTINHLDPASDIVGQQWQWRQNFSNHDNHETSIMRYDFLVAHWGRYGEKVYARLALWYYHGVQTSFHRNSSPRMISSLRTRILC